MHGAPKIKEEKHPSNKNNIEKDTPKETKETEKDNNKKDEKVFKHQSNTFFLFKPEQIFYEDTTLDIYPILERGAFQEFANNIHHLLQEIRIFEGSCDEKDKMTHFFENTYASNP